MYLLVELEIYVLFLFKSWEWRTETSKRGTYRGGNQKAYYEKADNYSIGICMVAKYSFTSRNNFVFLT